MLRRQGRQAGRRHPAGPGLVLDGQPFPPTQEQLRRHDGRSAGIALPRRQQGVQVGEVPAQLRRHVADLHFQRRRPALLRQNLYLVQYLRQLRLLLRLDAEFDGAAQGSVADGDEVTRTESLASNVSLKAPLFDGRLENLLVFGYADITRENLSDGAQSYYAEGDRFLYRYQGTVNINDMNTLAFGAEREETSSGDAESSIDGLFALYEFKPVNELTLTGGLRVDDHDTFGSETTARLAAAWNPTDQVTIRSSWGQGFKAPSIFQSTYICTFCGLTEPNADLQPETSEAFDVGVEWRSEDGRMEAGVTYFDQETENMIDFSFTAGYDNIALVKSQGIEIFGGYALTGWLNVSANYAYIDAEDGDGNELTRLPEHSGDVSVSIDPDGPFSGAVLVRYNGDEANTDGTTLDGWTRVDLTGRYALSESIELYGRVENLFDEDYQQIIGYGTPGLSGSVGIRLRY